MRTLEISSRLISRMLDPDGGKCCNEVFSEIDASNPIELLFVYISVDSPYLDMPKSMYHNLHILNDLSRPVSWDEFELDEMFHYASGNYVLNVDEYRPSSPILSIADSDSDFPHFISNPIQFAIEFSSSVPNIVDVAQVVDDYLKATNSKLPHWLIDRVRSEREYILTSDYYIYPHME